MSDFVCQVSGLGTDSLICPERESGGYQCENTEPGHTAHRVGSHTIYHSKWGNGYSCASVERTLRDE